MPGYDANVVLPIRPHIPHERSRQRPRPSRWEGGRPLGADRDGDTTGTKRSVLMSVSQSSFDARSCLFSPARTCTDVVGLATSEVLPFWSEWQTTTGPVDRAAPFDTPFGREGAVRHAIFSNRPQLPRCVLRRDVGEQDGVGFDGFVETAWSTSRPLGPGEDSHRSSGRFGGVRTPRPAASEPAAVTGGTI